MSIAPRRLRCAHSKAFSVCRCCASIWAGDVLLVLAYLQARSGGGSVLHEPWNGSRHLNMLLSLAGFILMASARGQGYIRRAVKHPQSLGMALWATGHILANGEMAVVVIFAAILVVALADIVGHVLAGVESYQRRQSCDKEHPEACEGVNQEADVGLELVGLIFHAPTQVNPGESGDDPLVIADLEVHRQGQRE